MSPKTSAAPVEWMGLPKVGDVFDGKYRIEGMLGVGGIGAVLAATHLRLDERVAIKLLLPESMGNPALVERFKCEGRVSSKIRSEHVVRVMDSGSFLGQPYLVLEYLDGHDLGALIETEGPMPVATAVDFVLQACEAIAEAHAAGIIHRDLKPTNLFLTHRADGSPCVKVLDFGISKMTRLDDRKSGMHTPRTLASDVMGSPHYMPPEQLEAATNVDERSDVWSLGAILHELLAGDPPFQAESITALCAIILRDPPARLGEARADVPPALEAVVRRCLEKDPSNRFANVAELGRALVRFGTPAAQASVATISKIVEGSGAVAVPASALPVVRPSPSVPPISAREVLDTLPPTPMRSSMPGYLLAALVLAIVAGVGSWAFVRQGQHLREAEARTDAPTVAAPSRIPPVPAPAPEPRVPTTTGAIVATSSTPPAETLTVVATAPVAPARRAPAPAAFVAPPPAHQHHAARRADPESPVVLAPSTSTDENPYAAQAEAPSAASVPAATAPAPAPAAPVDASQLFDERK